MTQSVTLVSNIFSFFYSSFLSRLVILTIFIYCILITRNISCAERMLSFIYLDVPCTLCARCEITLMLIGNNFTLVLWISNGDVLAAFARVFMRRN